MDASKESIKCVYFVAAEKFGWVVAAAGPADMTSRQHSRQIEVHEEAFQHEESKIENSFRKVTNDAEWDWKGRK